MSLPTPIPPCATCSKHGCTAHPDQFGSKYVVAYARLAASIQYLFIKARPSLVTLDPSGRPSKVAREVAFNFLEMAMRDLAKTLEETTGIKETI